MAQDESTSPSRRGRGALEDEVLRLLAGATESRTVDAVRSELGGTTAYTTVMTTLTRLHRKGALVRTQRGRAYLYRLASAPGSVPAVLAARRMRTLLDAEHDHADVLARFVAELEPGDEAVLASLIADHPAAPENTRTKQTTR